MIELQTAVSVVSAATAIIAVVVGPYVSLRIAKRQADTELENTRRQVEAANQNAARQIRAQTVLANRQNWINALRTDLAQYASVGAEVMFAGTTQGEPMGRFAKELMFLQTRIALSLNPTEPDHVQLIELLRTIGSKVVTGFGEHPGVERPRVRDELAQMVSLSQSIFKAEWERIKRGD